MICYLKFQISNLISSWIVFVAFVRLDLFWFFVVVTCEFAIATVCRCPWGKCDASTGKCPNDDWNDDSDDDSDDDSGYDDDNSGYDDYDDDDDDDDYDWYGNDGDQDEGEFWWGCAQHGAGKGHTGLVLILIRITAV